MDKESSSIMVGLLIKARLKTLLRKEREKNIFQTALIIKGILRKEGKKVMERC
jgi:hypothetical protein